MEINEIRDSNADYYSDKICTALQLTNFYQDVSIDIKKGRIYLPLDEMEKFGVSEKSLELKENNIKFTALLKYQVDRTRKMFEEGKLLLKFLPWKLKLHRKPRRIYAILKINFEITAIKLFGVAESILR